jgi:hypothetical protein
MSYLEILPILRHWPAPPGTLTEAGYAQLPFLLLARGQSPFDAWRRPESRVPGHLEAVWREAAAGWQLCAFQAVNAVTQGPAFGDRILEGQKRFLNGLREGFGDWHEATIRWLYAMAWQPLEIATGSGERVEVPPDWRAAVMYLRTNPHSPFRAGGDPFADPEPPTFPEEADLTLALDLERAWAVASDHFTARLRALKTA